MGLNQNELEQLAKGGKDIVKVSRRDMTAVMAKGGNGATTVSGTIVGGLLQWFEECSSIVFGGIVTCFSDLCSQSFSHAYNPKQMACDLAGIRVFATGGIGGVHRGAESSFDESADLIEMSRSSVCVVCAGAKTVLDIPKVSIFKRRRMLGRRRNNSFPRADPVGVNDLLVKLPSFVCKTLERLETLGVSVITLGQEDFPAFYTRSSGVRSPHSVHSVQEIAGMLNASDQLCLQSGTLVAVPVRCSSFSPPPCAVLSPLHVDTGPFFGKEREMSFFKEDGC